MIKIIKPSEEYIAECTRCGCRFTYGNEDLFRHDSPADGRHHAVRCPQCGMPNWVELEK